MIEPGARFTAHADAYAVNRPGYPPEAIDALLEGLGPREKIVAADLGAGTGISSRLLAERGVHVYAIEPNAAMRAQAQSHPLVTWIDGTAEASGLADASVDVAAAFQAFHWFDPRRALDEFRRISRRRIALLQYERDEREAFAAAYGALVRRYALEDTEARRLRALEEFATLAGPGCHRLVFSYAQTLDRERFRGRLASTSYLPREGGAAEPLRADAEALFERFARAGSVTVAMVCYVLLADA